MIPESEPPLVLAIWLHAVATVTSALPLAVQLYIQNTCLICHNVCTLWALTWAWTRVCWIWTLPLWVFVCYR